MSREDLLQALQWALEDYAFANTLQSQIQLHLHLGSRNMFAGLCHYFRKRHPHLEAEIITGLAELTGQELKPSFWFRVPADLDTVQEIKAMGIAPRLSLLQKAVATLQRELYQQSILEIKVELEKDLL